MRIALAQTRSVSGDVRMNMLNHLYFIRQALDCKADAVFFSELSVTGYEPELAGALAVMAEEACRGVFQDISDKKGITIGVGAPARTSGGIEIQMLVFTPERLVESYAKQQLHADELPFFVAGNQQLILWPEAHKMALAICYESLQESHVQYAHALGAGGYLASVAKDQKGIEKAYAHYGAIACRYQMPVLMVNCVGYCDNFESAGGSAVWNSKGELLASLDNTNEGLLVVELNGGEVYT